MHPTCVCLGNYGCVAYVIGVKTSISALPGLHGLYEVCPSHPDLHHIKRGVWSVEVAGNRPNNLGHTTGRAPPVLPTFLLPTINYCTVHYRVPDTYAHMLNVCVRLGRCTHVSRHVMQALLNSWRSLRSLTALLTPLLRPG
jgi:hypothetical protein